MGGSPLVLPVVRGGGGALEGVGVVTLPRNRSSSHESKAACTACTASGELSLE